MNPARHNNLDAMRLFLALNVAVGHGCHFWFGFDYRYGIAVSIFLGLSGYLVLDSRFNSVSAVHFLWKRFLRIYPLMIATISVGVLWLGRPLLPVLQWLVTAGLSGDPMLGPGWTIIVEEVMYVCLLVLFALNAYKHTWSIVALLGVTLVLMMSAYFEVSSDIQRIIVLPANFFFGNLLYLHRKALAPYYRFLTLPCAVIGFGFMMTSFPVAGPDSFQLALHMVAAFMGTIACIGLGLHTRPVFGWLRRTIGDLSYSVYLIHSLLIGWFLPHPLSSNVLTFAAFIGTTLLLAGVSWRFIEQPALSFRDLPVTSLRRIITQTRL